MHAVNDVTLRARRGRDARAGGGVGLRQDHPVAHDHAPARLHRRARSASAGGHHAGRAQGAAAAAARRCRWSSRTRSPRSTRASAWARSSALPLRLHGAGSEERSSAKVRELLDRVGLQPEHVNRYPARVLRRAAPADRSGPRARARAAADRARRAGVRAGRLGPGADHQPAGRPPGRVRAHLPVRGPRPVAWCATCPTGSR